MKARFLWSLVGVGLFAVAGLVKAESVETTPEGYVTVTIAGGTPSSPATSLISFPLSRVADREGSMSGRITGVSGSVLEVTNAGWIAGDLSKKETPHFVRIVGGERSGRTLLISANTTNALTVQGSLEGVAVGDYFEIVPADTLGTLFGASTLLGGNSSSTADNVVTFSNGAYLTYYYNTTNNQWQRDLGAPVSRNDVVIRPDTGFFIIRRGPALDWTVLGRVSPVSARIATSKNSLINSGFPSDVTLGELALERSIAGWVSHTDANLADKLSVFSGGAWVTYFHNGTHWRRSVGSSASRDHIVIPACAPFMITRTANEVGTVEFVRQAPY